MSWQSLASFGGASVTVGVLTQLFKGLFDKLPFHLPTRVLSYIFALAVLLCATAFTGGDSVGDYMICLINAAFVSLASNGAYDMVTVKKNDTTNYDEPDDGTGSGGGNNDNNA